MLSIGALGSAAQGARYYENDSYFAKDDPEHRQASAWFGKGSQELGLEGPVDPDIFRAVLEGKVPDGSGIELGRRGRDGKILHRPGRDLTFSAPKSVSLAALVGGDARIVDAHDRAVKAVLAWVEKNAAETRMKDPVTGQMIRAGDQKIVAATFRHDTSRNLDPQLHTHSVIANMVQGEDGKWRTMTNEGLYERQKLIGMLYRNELAGSLAKLGYDIEKTHADGRFEIGGISREAIEAFSTRCAEIEAAMNERGLGATADNPRLAERAALMTRAKKRDIDRDELRSVWQKQAADLGLDARALVAALAESVAVPAREGVEGVGEPARDPGKAGETVGPALPEFETGPQSAGPSVAVNAGSGDRGLAVEGPAPRRGAAAEAVAWAMAHLLRAPGGLRPRRSLRRRARPCAGHDRHRGSGTGGRGAREGRRAAWREHPRRRGFARHRSDGGRGVRDDCAHARGSGPRAGADAELAGPGASQQGTAHGRAEGGGDAHPVGEGPRGGGPGLCWHRQDHHARPGADPRGEEGIPDDGPRTVGLGGADPGLRGGHRVRDPAALPRPQRRRRRGSAHKQGREGDARRLREDRAGGDEGSLASTVQARDLLRIASEFRIPRVVLVGDAKQLDAVDAGKPFAQLQAAGMQTAVMDEIMR